jgi:hypothetical protein
VIDGRQADGTNEQGYDSPMGEDASRDQPALELIRHFELFRGPPPPAAEVLSEREAETVLRLDGAGGLGLIASLARSIQLSPSVKVIAMPGKQGAFLLISTVRPDGTPDLGGGGAPLGVVLRGEPILTSGAMIYGLAPDGVSTQQVAGAGGSVISAPVVSNVYAVLDPSWRPPVFVDA